MVSEWIIIAAAILIICAFALGVIVGVCMGLDISVNVSDDIWGEDDFKL